MNAAFPYHLSLLGPPALRAADGKLVAFPQKAFALVAFLYYSNHERCSRNTLAATLYAGVSQSTAMSNLRQLLTRVQAKQAELGIELLAISRDEVCLPTDNHLMQIDLRSFDAIEAVNHGNDLRRLMDLYKGELLEGISGNGEAFDTWLAVHRLQVRTQFFQRLQLGARYASADDGEMALRRILEIDPYREDVWRMLIAMLGRHHGYATAERAYAEMCRCFDIELGATPERKTTELVESLRRGGRLHPVADSNFRPAEALHRPASKPQEHAELVSPRLCVLIPTPAEASSEDVARVGSLIEDVTLGLCRLRSIAVIAPHTAWRLADEHLSVPEEFQLDYIVETNLRTVGGTSRLVVKLIRTVDRVIVFGDSYDLSLHSNEHYARLSNAIVLALADSVERAGAAGFTSTPEPSAYQLFLQGRHHLRILDLPDIRRARKAFTGALDRDPLFASAHSGVARTLIQEWLLLARTDQDILRHAQNVAQRAVEIDPLSGEALRELAASKLFLGGLDEAIHHFDAAERLSPHHAGIIADHANALSHCSQMSAAMGKIESAINLNPLPPDEYLWTAGGALFFLENYESALHHLERMKRQEPAFRLTAACLAMVGRQREAASFVTRALEAQPNFRLQDWLATIPLRSKSHVALYANALSKAGFR